MLIDDGLALLAACVGLNERALDRRSRQALVPKRNRQIGQLSQIAGKRAGRLRARTFAAIHVQRQSKHETDNTPLLGELKKAPRIAGKTRPRKRDDRRGQPAAGVANRDSDGFGAKIESDQCTTLGHERGGFDKRNDWHGAQYHAALQRTNAWERRRCQ